jgi:hypothetical protein
MLLIPLFCFLWSHSLGWAAFSLHYLFPSFLPSFLFPFKDNVYYMNLTDLELTEIHLAPPHPPISFPETRTYYVDQTGWDYQ